MKALVCRQLLTHLPPELTLPQDFLWSQGPSLAMLTMGAETDSRQKAGSLLVQLKRMLKFEASSITSLYSGSYSLHPGCLTPLTALHIR